MDTDVRRGLGLTLAGVLTWGLAAVIVLALQDPPPAVETLFGLVALMGLLAAVVGLGRVAWTLLRR